MRALFLSPYVPWPVLHGGHNRAWSLIRALSGFSTVHVLAVGDPAEARSDAAREELARHGVTLDVHPATGPGPQESDPYDERRLPDAISHFRSPGLARALEAFARAAPPEVVLLEELVMAQYAGGLSAPLVMDRQKVEWRYHEAVAAAGHDAAAHRAEARRFRLWDESLSSTFAAVLVTGRGDALPLEPIYGAERIHVVPIGVDERFSRPPDRVAAVEHVLLYGTLDYPPNALANASYFREVWPILRDAPPPLRTLVVGSGAPPPSLPREDPRVETRGYVEDIAAVLRGPGVLLAPLQVGGGSRTKILEALACGMPVVSTRVGVENLGLEAGRHYLHAENATEMAEAVLRLARDPVLASSLGREGSRRVEEGFRQPAVARVVEPLCRRLAGTVGIRVGGRASSRRALLVGVHPLPDDEEARGLGFPGHRTAQFRDALRDAGCAVEAVLLDEEGSARGGGGGRVLRPEEFRAGRELQRVHDAIAPDVVVAAGGYHAARVVSGLATPAARWIDLPGDLAAEGQLRAAHSGDGAAILADYLAVLDRALATGDEFSVVGPSQRLSLLGQLGARGRLTPETTGRDPVAVVPLASEGPPSPPPLPAGGLRVLSSGGYNTWMDTETMFAGLEEAMARCDGIVFVSTGGPAFDRDPGGHRAFWARARASRFAARFEDRGRVTRAEARAVLCGSHVAISIARPCLEAELGSRQRVVEAMAYGRAVVITGLGDLARSIGDAGAGITVPPGDAAALASALLRLAGDRAALTSLARDARALWEAGATPRATTAPLRDWAARPSRWPAPAAAGVEERLLRLQSEMDHIRGSRTFRALRLLDRLRGRGR